MSEEAKWKNDTKELDRLLSSYEEYTEDGSIGSGSGLLDGSYVDVNQERGYGFDVNSKKSSSSAILNFFFLFLTVGFGLGVYSTVTSNGSLPGLVTGSGGGDGTDAGTILSLSSNNYLDNLENRANIVHDEYDDELERDVDDLAHLQTNIVFEDELDREVDDLAHLQPNVNDDKYDDELERDVDDLAHLQTNIVFEDELDREVDDLAHLQPGKGDDDAELMDDDDEVKFTAMESGSSSSSSVDKTNLRGPKKSSASSEEIQEEKDKLTIEPVKEDGKRPKINRIALLAERNSGLSWFASELHSCFPDLEITMGLARASHWFQSNETAIPEPTIVFPLFLNVYHWVESMRNSPHHAPNHRNKEWVQFVSEPWSVHRPKEDFELLEKVKDNAKLNCQLNFKYKEVISCTDMTIGLGKDAPIYELNNNGSGEPYLSILHLRRDKILNWLSTSGWENVEFVHPVHYEDLVERGGLLSAIKVIELKTNMKSSCSYELSRNNIAPIFWDKLQIDYIDWMKNNAMWDVERKIGYEKVVPLFTDTPNEPHESTIRGKENS